MIHLVAAEQLIYTLWEQLFGREGLLRDQAYNDPNLALHFVLGLSIENFGYEKDGNTYHPEWSRYTNKVIHVIVTSRHRVYVAVVDLDVDAHHVDRVILASFKNTSNHDSCWHSDGLSVFHKQLEEAWDHCFAWLPEEHQPPNRYTMNPMTTVGGSLFPASPVKLVRVTRGKHPDAEERKDGYRDALTAIEPVEFTMTVCKGAKNEA